MVNREKDDFAHAFQLLHGPSVCALTLQVDSVDRAIDRARAMLCQTHIGRIGPGEALIPAVGGIEGSLIYFVDGSGADWRDDFAPVAGDRAAGQLDSASTTCTMSCAAANSCPGRCSTRRCSGLEARAGRSRSPIRMAPSTAACCATATARCASRSTSPTAARPASPASSTSLAAPAISRSLFRPTTFSPVVEAARLRGVEFLPIPDNYYDDLATRFEIAPERLARLRSLGVLYDRIRDGEFLHIYTRDFRDRFFFEIVERANYDLFGAANTPVRLAAQAALDDAEERLEADFGA